jgi:3-oxoacyl-[acyl-carrier protein] reductase
MVDDLVLRDDRCCICCHLLLFVIGLDRTFERDGPIPGDRTKADVTKRDDVEALIRAATDKYGHLDVVVNNAGVYEWLPLDKITEKHFHWLFDVNVLGTILVSQEALPYFTESGGSVINMSSIVSLYPSEAGPVYSATKGAIDALTQSNAKAYASRKIRFNTLHPGFIATEGVSALGELGVAISERVKAATPKAARNC